VTDVHLLTPGVGSFREKLGMAKGSIEANIQTGTGKVICQDRSAQIDDTDCE